MIGEKRIRYEKKSSIEDFTFSMVRVTGIEPARRRRLILSQVRLPVPPYPHDLDGDPQATRTPDPLIKSQMLYRLS